MGMRLSGKHAERVKGIEGEDLEKMEEYFEKA